MKLIKYYSISFLIFCSLLSCKKDFLTVIDKTTLLNEGYVVDLATTKHYLNGIYTDFGVSYTDGSWLPYPEIMADNMKPIKSSAFVGAYNWNFNSTGISGVGDPITTWQRYYTILRNCCFALEKAEEYKDQNLDKADDIKGQALAIRAMVHFRLVCMFAQSYNFTSDASHPGIPYVTSSDRKAPISRITVADVYSGIISDLKGALDLLPRSEIIKGVMNYQATKALLARVYLFKEDFINSKNMAMEVLKDFPIMMANYPTDLYSTKETEALFQMAPTANSAQDSYPVVVMGYYCDPTGSLYYVATSDIAQLLRENLNDKRSTWVKQDVQGWLITKFPKGVAKIYPTAAGDHYQTIFRSSEMCLTAAEAYARLNMEDSARVYIDAIRRRANPSVAVITATGPALLDSIYKERRKEMAFDGLRMFDLLRWKKGVNRLDAANANIQNLPYPSDKAIAPLPKQDVELLGFSQNPGYN